MPEFDAERAALISDLAESRGHLVEIVRQLSPEDFTRARRGSWSVAKILDHVLHSERLYTQLVSVFSGKPTDVPDTGSVGGTVEATSALDASRAAFLLAIDDVTEDGFFRLQAVGHEEYSVLSIIENNASHDREHAEQIRRTIRD